MVTHEHIAVIILAAGGSSRMGTAKQLLAYAGKTLLQYTVDAANESSASRVFVVLGADAANIRDEVKNAAILVNKEWQEGMASSIRCGLNALLQEDASAEGALMLVCDQPYISSDLLNSLVTQYRKTGKPIVASSYDHTVGVPAFFHKSIFPALLQLEGDAGAKSIIQQHSRELETVPFLKGGVDIDTEEDYRKLSLSTVTHD